MEDLYAKYSKDFRNVVDRVFGEEYPELSDQLRANVSRFAAYKSNYVKTAFEDNSKAFSGDDLKAANEATKNQFRSWTETELATASARARTAKQFSEFNEADRKELFPCLKWLPSRAANPRQSHMRFYNRVWRKDDPFWNNNAPGTEWNCACDVEECDDQPTDNSKVKQPIVPQGLEGNPASTGEVFTDKASYIAKASEETHNIISTFYFPDNKSTLEISVMPDFRELSDNIKTGRILSTIEQVKIRPHFSQERGNPIKNPEYEVNGNIGDAKRIHSEKGIPDAFSKALKQGCSVVILDYDKMNVSLTFETAKRISNRSEDFLSNRVTYCYVVKNKKFVKIGRDIFLQYPKDKIARNNAIFEVIKKAFD